MPHRNLEGMTDVNAQGRTRMGDRRRDLDQRAIRSTKRRIEHGTNTERDAFRQHSQFNAPAQDRIDRRSMLSGSVLNGSVSNDTVLNGTVLNGTV